MKIIEKYQNFFLKNIHENAVILQGSRRSGKTIAILQWLLILASGGGKKVLIISPDYPMLSALLEDFEKLSGTDIRRSAKLGLYALRYNSLFSFRAFDKPQKAQGTAADIIFFNECAQISEQLVNTAILSARAQLFFDFNPTKKFWIEKFYNARKTNILKTTFADNPFLTESQKDWFLKLKFNAESPAASMLDRYMYDVYYRGEYGTLTGNVFPRVTAERFDFTDTTKTCYGLDFGFSNDPCALVEIAVMPDNTLLVKQKIYETGIDDFQLAEKIKAIGLKPNVPIVYDFGGGGDARAANLHRLIKNPLIPANKGAGSVLAQLQLMANYSIIIDGTPAFAEFAQLELDNGKPKGSDHAVDAARYALERCISTGYFAKNK